jgi:hypothetical protein
MIDRLWEVFVDRIDLLIKVVHKPSFLKLLDQVATAPESLSPSSEALIFCVYCSAIAGFDDDDCQQILGEAKLALSRRYRLLAHQALLNADFLRSSSLSTLQGLLLFLVSPYYLSRKEL